MAVIVRISMVIAIHLLGTHSLHACDCHEGGPICEAFWKTPIVFAGRVESVSPIPRFGTSGPTERVQFRVLEGLRGTTELGIELFNYNSSCHFNFAIHQDWLVYAFPREDGPGLTTFTCSRTRPLRFATEDIAYARAAYARSPNKGRVFGRLTYSHHDGQVAVPGVRITLTDSWIAPAMTETDRQGRFEIMAPAATYRLTAMLPPGMTIRSGAGIIRLADNRGCAAADILADYPGRVTGKILDAIGAPVPNMTVEMIRADRRDYAPFRLRGITNASGDYEVSGLEPGMYLPAVLVGYNANGHGLEPRYLFASGATTKKDARPLRVDGGSRAAGDDLILSSDVHLTQLIGLVVHADGRPADGVKVRMKADFNGEDFPWTTIRTDTRGGFAFTVVRGSRYRVVAEPAAANVGAHRRKAAAITVDPSRFVQKLRLVVP